MARNKKHPDMHKVLVNNIESLCDLQGISQEEQIVIMRMSPATYFRRKAHPETFRLSELEKIANKLSVTVQELLSERKSVYGEENIQGFKRVGSHL